jgi:hypothetical protein
VKKIRNIDIFTIVLAVLLIAVSAFAVFQNNKAYFLDYEWYSPSENGFVSDKRDVVLRGKSADVAVMYAKFITVTNIGEYKEYPKNMEGPDSNKIIAPEIAPEDFNKYLYLIGYLGSYRSRDFDIRFLDVYQSRNIVEVLTNVNVDQNYDPQKFDEKQEVVVQDIIRIPKSAFFIYRDLTVIFKASDGTEITRMNCEI